MNPRRRGRACSALLVVLLWGGAFRAASGQARSAPTTVGAAEQPPAPVERVTFDEAIRRAVEKNPSAAIAVAGILRAEGLLLDARSASRMHARSVVASAGVASARCAS